MSLMVAAIFAEISVRVLKPIPDEELLPLSYNQAELDRIIQGGTYYRFDPFLGWAIGAGAVGGFGRATYRSNAAGLRADRDYELQPPLGVRRIAAFGDSFTHCDEVSYQNCWTARLEETWPGSEILNFGVPGYGPDQAWLRYERDGRPYRPCAVLIDFFVENINRVVNRFRPFYAIDDGIVLSKPRFQLDGEGLRLLSNPTERPEQLKDPVWVERNLGPGDAWYFPSMVTSVPLDVFQLARITRSAAFRQSRRTMLRGGERYPLYESNAEAVMLVERIITEFAREVERDGATPVVVFFPGRRDATDSSIRNVEEPYTAIERRLQAEGLAVIDLVDIVQPVITRSGTDSLYAEHGHYSAQGNRLIAEGLRARLPDVTSGTCPG